MNYFGMWIFNNYFLVLICLGCLIYAAWAITAKWEWKVPVLWEEKLNSLVSDLSGKSITLVKKIDEEIDMDEFGNDIYRLKRQLKSIQKTFQLPVWLNLQVKCKSSETKWYLKYLMRCSWCSVDIYDSPENPGQG